MPLISVVVPVYNVEKYLNRCVDSILNQTFTDFELILVDDGSPDNCGKICDEYKEKDSRIKVIHKKNGGRSDAKNSGIELVLNESISEWIAFVDSDDWIHPRYFEFLLKAAIENNVSIVACEYAKAKEYTSFPIVEFHSNVCSMEKFWMSHNVVSVVPWGKLYKKKDFTGIRYPIGKIHEDVFTTHKILFKYNDIAFVNEELYYYFTNPEGIMNSKWTPKRLDALTAIQSEIDFFDKKGMLLLKNYERKVYVTVACGQINDILLSDIKDDKKKYLHFLRKQVRRQLRKYNDVMNFSVKNEPWIFECAHPKRMWLYWFIKAQIDKIKKVS